MTEYKLVPGFTPVDKNSPLELVFNDEICIVSKKPWWLPPFAKGVFIWLLQKCPAMKRLQVAYAGQEHHLVYTGAENDDKYLYLYYKMDTNAVPVAIIVIAVASIGLLAFLNGYLVAVAVRKTTGPLGENLFTYITLGCVVAGLVFLGKKFKWF